MTPFGLVCLFRNEADIIQLTLKQAQALFPWAFFIAHKSEDGSAKAVQKGLAPGWQLQTVSFTSYEQEKWTTDAAQWLFKRTACKGVVVLDADEFLPKAPRLTTGLGLLQVYHCKGFPQGDYLEPLAPSPNHKVVVSREVWQEFPGFRYGLGNHAIAPGPKAAKRIGKILHFPLRSAQQAERKKAEGAEALAARSVVPAANHWLAPGGLTYGVAGRYVKRSFAPSWS